MTGETKTAHHFLHVLVGVEGLWEPTPEELDKVVLHFSVAEPGFDYVLATRYDAALDGPEIAAAVIESDGSIKLPRPGDIVTERKLEGLELSADFENDRALVEAANPLAAPQHIDAILEKIGSIKVFAHNLFTGRAILLSRVTSVSTAEGVISMLGGFDTEARFGGSTKLSGEGVICQGNSGDIFSAHLELGDALLLIHVGSDGVCNVLNKFLHPIQWADHVHAVAARGGDVGGADAVKESIVRQIAAASVK